MTAVAMTLIDAVLSSGSPEKGHLFNHSHGFSRFSVAVSKRCVLRWIQDSLLYVSSDTVNGLKVQLQTQLVLWVAALSPRLSLGHQPEASSLVLPVKTWLMESDTLTVSFC